MSNEVPSPPASSSTTTSNSDRQPEKLSAFEKWRRQAVVVTGYGLSKDEHLTAQCNDRKGYLMEASPTVVFMRKHLKAAGCDVPPENIFCAPCGSAQAGGFHPEAGGIVLCTGHFFNKKHQESTMVHEMIHMFDQCRFKVDWSNLRHHACSEIRANSLSGDCTYRREITRGKFAFTKNHQACVRRRAITSVKANPSCPDEATAEKIVNEVFESCFADTRPFDQIY